MYNIIWRKSLLFVLIWCVSYNFGMGFAANVEDADSAPEEGSNEHDNQYDLLVSIEESNLSDIDSYDKLLQDVLSYMQMDPDSG